MDFAVYGQQLRFLVPEIALLAVAVVALFAHVFMRRGGARAAGLISFFGLFLVLWLQILAPAGGPLYSGTLMADGFSFFFKVIVLLAAALTVVLSFRFFDVECDEPGEVYYLLLFAVAGMMFTVSATDLITFYVAFELFAIVSYVLAGIFKKERRSAEAGLKYFILGILSSAVMLLGMALLYGLSGQTAFDRVAAAIGSADPRLAVTAMLLLLVGIFFKMALVPFHMWTPDVYEGAPTPLVAFLSTAPKTAVFAVAIRLLLTVFAPLESQWRLVIGLVAVLSMFWGNVAALHQENIKRMMAYSSIAHAGYMAIGLVALGPRGIQAVLFYLFAYLFMNTAAFALVLVVQARGGFGERVSDLAGLARRQPLLSAAVVVLLLSLTGIPPTAGFMGKYYLFNAAVQMKFYWLAVAGALNSVISLFYYFRIGRAIFMEEPNGPTTVDHSLYARAVLAVCVALLLVFGVLPGPLADFAASVLPG